MPESHRYMYDADADTDTGRGSCADKNSQVHHIRRVLTMEEEVKSEEQGTPVINVQPDHHSISTREIGLDMMVPREIGAPTPATGLHPLDRVRSVSTILAARRFYSPIMPTQT